MDRATADLPASDEPIRLSTADRFHTAAGILAVIVMLIGGGVIVGWVLNIDALKTVFPKLVAMRLSTALALLLSGAALWIYQRPGVSAGRSTLLLVLSATAGGLGLLRLAESFGGFNLGIDHLFLPVPAAPNDPADELGRMVLSTAAALILFNAAIVLAERTERLLVPHVLVCGAATLTGLSAIGHVFGVPMLTGGQVFNTMAPHTSWATLLLCAGFLLAHPTSAIMTIVADEGPAGFVVRRLLPAVFFLPILLGLIWWQGNERQWYDPAFTMTLFVSSTIGTLGLLVWLSGNLVQGLDVRRVAAEQERQQSEERLRRAVTEAPVPMVIHDDADRVLHMSQGWTDLSGYSMADVPTVSQWITVAQQATRAEAEAYLRRLWTSEQTVHGGEVAIRTRTGAQRYWEFSTTPLGQLGGGRPTFLSMAIDVTERRQSEAELRQLNEQLELHIAERTAEVVKANEELQRQSEQLREQAALLDLASDGIIVRDQAGTVVYWSAGASAMFGFSREEAIGRRAGQLLRKVFSEPREQIERQVISTGHWEGEITMTRKDGSTIAVESHWTMTRSGQFLEMHRDVTARRMAAESLRESELRFRAVAETAAVGVVMADEQGTIRYWNPGAETMFGWMEEDALGQPLTVIMPERFRAAHDAGLKRYLATRESRFLGRTMELAGLRQDGTEFPIELSISSWRTSKGTFFSAFLRDITARKDAEQVLRAQAEDLARSNQELEQFAYVASHDLQEPLRMVSNYTQLLASRYRDRLDGDALEFIDFAVDGAKRMQALIHDLLQYARVGTRGKEFKATPVNAILAETIANLAGAIEDTKADIRVDPLPTIRCDQSQLAQVFQNLIGNALKFRRPDARPIVHVTAEPEDGYWRFSVSDNGIGIDPKYFDRIFQMFQRLHGRDQYEGTGIGLALCRKIVERHGGRIFVDSQPGRGTTFSFTIPEAAVTAARAS